MDRRLAAILSMDVVGYSHLMAVDEVGTLGRLNLYCSFDMLAAILQRTRRSGQANLSSANGWTRRIQRIARSTVLTTDAQS